MNNTPSSPTTDAHDPRGHSWNLAAGLLQALSRHDGQQYGAVLDGVIDAAAPVAHQGGRTALAVAVDDALSDRFDPEERVRILAAVMAGPVGFADLAGELEISDADLTLAALSVLEWAWMRDWEDDMPDDIGSEFFALTPARREDCSEATTAA